MDVKMGTMAEFRINPVLNKILEWLLNFELVLIRSGVNFPVGGSRLLIARKQMIEHKDS